MFIYIAIVILVVVDILPIDGVHAKVNEIVCASFELRRKIRYEPTHEKYV